MIGAMVSIGALSALMWAAGRIDRHIPGNNRSETRKARS